MSNEKSSNDKEVVRKLVNQRAPTVLSGKDGQAIKTQALVFDDRIVDTPGEYIENPMYYRNIMATSLEVTHVIYLQDATSSRSVFPPQFSLGIPKIQIGVITKIDAPLADVERATALLKNLITDLANCENISMAKAGH
ncbi:hypothetical protein LSPH24S_07726 [Lysinibacillus sphaericus]